MFKSICIALTLMIGVLAFSDNLAEDKAERRVQPKWSFSPPMFNAAYITSPPTAFLSGIGTGTVFVGYDKSLYGLDVKTGKQKWIFRSKGKINSSLAFDYDAIIFGSEDGHLYAVDQKRRKLKWKFATGAPVGSPIVIDGTIYVGSGISLYAVNSQNGKLKWKFTSRGPLSLSRLACQDRMVIFLSNDDIPNHKSHIYGINAMTGDELWKKEFVKSQSSSHSSIYPMSIVDGLLYLGWGSKIYALDIVTGDEKWASPTDNMTLFPVVKKRDYLL